MPAAQFLKKIPCTDCMGGWVIPRAVWMGVENLVCTWIQCSDHPVRTLVLNRYLKIYSPKSW